jgi:hypothetical protein
MGVIEPGPRCALSARNPTGSATDAWGAARALRECSGRVAEHRGPTGCRRVLVDGLRRATHLEGCSGARDRFPHARARPVARRAHPRAPLALLLAKELAQPSARHLLGERTRRHAVRRSHIGDPVGEEVHGSGRLTDGREGRGGGCLRPRQPARCARGDSTLLDAQTFPHRRCGCVVRSRTPREARPQLREIRSAAPVKLEKSSGLPDANLPIARSFGVSPPALTLTETSSNSKAA